MRKGRSRASSTVTGVFSTVTGVLLSILLTTAPLLPCQVLCFVSGSNHNIMMRNRRSPTSIIPGIPPFSSSSKKSSHPRRPLVPVVAAGALPSPTIPTVIFDNGPNLRFQLIVLSANALGYVISLLFRGLHLHVDLLGTGAFALGALPELLMNNPATTATATGNSQGSSSSHNAYSMVIGRGDCLECSIGWIFILPHLGYWS